MPMALSSFPPLSLLFLTMFFAFAVSTRATTKDSAPSPPAPAPPPPPGSMFLRACCAACANATDASICYDILLPSAGSFHGNLVKVARAAAVIAFAQLRSFYDGLRRLQPGGTGAGRVPDMALGDCATFVSDSLGRKGDLLARLGRLETAAGRSRGEHAKWDLNDAILYAGAVDSGTTECIDLFASIGNVTLTSPVVKKLVTWATNVHVYGGIAQDLVASIKLEM